MQPGVRLATDEDDSKYTCCTCCPVRLAGILVAIVYFLACMGMLPIIIFVHLQYQHVVITLLTGFGIVCCLMCTVLLFIGVFRENTSCLWTYMIVSTFLHIIQVIVKFTIGVMYCTSSNAIDRLLGKWAVVTSSITIVLIIWFMYVIYCLIKFYKYKKAAILNLKFESSRRSGDGSSRSNSLDRMIPSRSSSLKHFKTQDV